ncbi:hypothetical protein DOK67_0002809 [Enterococcus sp. DIV0212c]|uniref:hypothetical protein n=1 Tax=Enterococcus sp. DIV0212c TaxID=2230867 RepID=UPI001A9B6268|nr:hypothetical protein [Enterococcus sp. DIV0212c]MBO1353135.1 hypothetical protein [Enterococcus sp. DIV0212c]
MLRRKGRKSVNKRFGDRRGRFTDVKTIHERPTKAETREELGHWMMNKSSNSDKIRLNIKILIDELEIILGDPMHYDIINLL